MSAGSQLRRGGSHIAAWVRSAPGTYIYLFALLVTSWSLHGADPRLADALIRSQSTNLDNLTDRPVQVLIASAFWTYGTAIPWLLLVSVSVIMAPVERRIGTWRTVGIFVAGHVIATLLVAAGIEYGLKHGMLDEGLAHAQDVGASYGLFAVAGALTWLLTPPLLRLFWVLAMLSVISLDALAGVTFTDVGHFLSLLIGVSMAPLVRRWQRHPPAGVHLPGQPVAIRLHRLRSPLR